MTNLLITRTCNLACSYCFAAPEMNAGGQDFIPLEDFARRLDYLEHSGIRQARLLGGEPTLHPRFAELVQMALERGRQIFVFTNAIMPQRALDALVSIPPEQCMVLVNANASAPRLAGDTLAVRRRQVMQALGPRCRVGFTIYRPDFDLEPLLRLIYDTGASPSIRLGLAQPAGEANRCIAPRLYPAVGHRIATFAGRAAREGIQIELDCGFVRCMFSDADLEQIQSAHPAPAWRCGPVIDLGLDGSASHCFPLVAQGSIPQATQLDAATLRARLEGSLSGFQSLGIYAECSACVLRSSAGCSGGCLAWKIKRAGRREWQARIPQEIAASISASLLT